MGEAVTAALGSLALEGPALSVYSILKLALAVWLFSRALPLRQPSAPRVAGMLAAVGVAAVASVGLGFSVFPTLTDDFSFVTAVATFVGVLALAVAAQLVVWECSLWTAIFCCSMAYLLENLSSSVDMVLSTAFPYTVLPPPLLEGSLRYWAAAAAVYAVAYLLLIRRVEKGGLLSISDPVMVVTAALAIVVNMMLDLVIKDIATPTFGLPGHYVAVLRGIYLILCVYVMYSAYEIVYTRRLKLNMAAVERLRATEARQYEMSRENIEAINLKCHDLRHQIRELASGAAMVDGRVLDELGQQVDVYDSVVKSGNDALDTILTEKSLVCQKRGITLSVIADGALLDFMAPADLYSLFGNALDNAIEATGRLADPEQRLIRLALFRQGGFAVARVENYFDSNLRHDADGALATTKRNRERHGFGVKSIRHIARSYGGELTIDAADHWFDLRVLLPLPLSPARDSDV